MARLLRSTLESMATPCIGIPLVYRFPPHYTFGLSTLYFPNPKLVLFPMWIYSPINQNRMNFFEIYLKGYRLNEASHHHASTINFFILYTFQIPPTSLYKSGDSKILYDNFLPIFDNCYKWVYNVSKIFNGRT